VVYACVSSAVAAPGVFKSVDAGRSFVRLGDAGFIAMPSLVLVDPRNSHVVYAARSPVCRDTCSPGGVVKSTDGGATWADTARSDNLTFALAIDPNDSLFLYDSGYDVPLQRQTGGLYRTTDGGLTWPPMFEGLSYIGYLTVDRESRVTRSPAFSSKDHCCEAIIMGSAGID
jgi:hypothetical protein